MNSRQFLIPFLLTGAAIGVAQDDVWIQKGINEAVAAGKTSYVLPAGTFVVDKRIRVPRPVKNFAILGAGPDATVLTTPNVKIDYVFYIGSNIQNHNNHGINQHDPKYSVELAKEGSSTIRLAPGQPAMQPGNYVIYDQYKVRHADNNAAFNRTEIVKVLHYDEASRTAKLDVALGRDYTLTPQIAFLKDSIWCENVSVSNVGFDGKVNSGGGSNGLVHVGLTQGVYLSNIKIRNFATCSLNIMICRDVHISNVDIADATNTGPGSGYGIFISRSRFVTVKDSSASRCRHGFITHTGAMDVLFENCVGNGASFDTHGYDERRITFRNCSGDTGLDVGNSGWLGGAKHVLIENCNLNRLLRLHPNTDDVVVRNSKFGGIQYHSREPHSVSVPSGGMPMRSYYYSTTFDGLTLINNNTKKLKIGSATFIGCTFNYERSSFGRILDLQDIEGNLKFVSCNFTSTSPSYPMFLMSSKKFNFTMQSCIVNSPTGAEYALWLKAPMEGVVNLTRNRFVSNTTKVVRFTRNDTALPVREVGTVTENATTTSGLGMPTRRFLMMN
jgi:hypothetical protein